METQKKRKLMWVYAKKIHEGTKNLKCSLKNIRGGFGGTREAGAPGRKKRKVFRLETHENSVLDSVIKCRMA